MSRSTRASSSRAANSSTWRGASRSPATSPIGSVPRRSSWRRATGGVGRVRVTGSGLLARAIQHEYAHHLQGELYVDRLPKETELIPASRLRELSEPDDEPARVGEGAGELAPVV